MLQLTKPHLSKGGSSHLSLLVLVSMLLGAGAWEVLRPRTVQAAIPNPDLVRSEMLKEIKALRGSQDATTKELRELRALLAGGGLKVRVISPTNKTTKSQSSSSVTRTKRSYTK